LPNANSASTEVPERPIEKPRSSLLSSLMHLVDP
jgi:hypothetical protein